jgi:2-dehydropantoate 2-reductase
MASFAPAVGPGTAILPLLNGLRHLDALKVRFGDRHVLGGQCMISASLDPEGRIVHLGDAHSLTFGELDGAETPRVAAIATLMSARDSTPGPAPTFCRRCGRNGCSSRPAPALPA